jgi:hypothetical protein
MLPDARWKYVCGLCDKIKRCGEDTEDGCESLVPLKIKKTDVATVYAEWKNTSEEDDGENIVIKCTPEIVLKIFKRISDDDITFMGFSPKWSRPELYLLLQFAHLLEMTASKGAKTTLLIFSSTL